MPDITQALKSNNVSLEKQAHDAFGAAVDSSKGRLTSGSPSNTNSVGTTTSEDKIWSSTDFAASLLKPSSFNPKLKFMFKVSFKIDPSMAIIASGLGYDLSSLQENLTFIVRHVDRPKFDYDYEEVNMYNFRTKVLKSIKHREISLTIFDDVGNAALSFVNVYRKLLQPITRVKQDPLAAHEDYGFSFGGDIDTSLRTLLPDGRKNILTEMTIHQIFVERGSDVQDPSSWIKVVNFVFMNPRFTNIDIDDLDHENGGNFNIITFSVDFDTVFMDEPQAMTAETGGPTFAGGDVSLSNGGTSAAGGLKNTATHQQFQQGMDTFNQWLSAGGASSVEQTKKIGGVVQEAGQKTINNLMNNKPQQAIARPAAPAVVDSAVSPTIATTLTRQIKGGGGTFDGGGASGDW